MAPNTYIALFRAINVGGRNILPMAELVALLESAGAKNVRTYIQSGNAVFNMDRKAESAFVQALTRAISKRHGFEPQVLLLGRDTLDASVANNPFPDATSNPATLHLGFLASTPLRPDLKALAQLKQSNERFHLADRVLYLHAPDGIARSRLATAAERALGTPMTLRNWRTVCKLCDLAKK